ncbi:expressed unknown protein [Seminavis robusta]|uniref:Uncharacterized protein n=1 Tax=Seminavis robusta TaxID=568900 RepID=A0A9N8EY26_9STRA|nr:expressed unknown protein [Seminavis robusta]|eukprot:Sro2354_g324510.1 n/a (557) ;mRNA; f:7313-8983
MPFYWMAVKPWVSDMRRVACIEIAGKNKKLMDLSDVKSVNDLMLKKAMPIRNITFKYAKAAPEKDKSNAGDYKLEAPLIGHNETLGETLERMKRIKKAKKNQCRRSSSGGKAAKHHHHTHHENHHKQQAKTPFGTWRPNSKGKGKGPETHTSSERLTPTELKSLLQSSEEEQEEAKIQHVKRPSLPVLPSERLRAGNETTEPLFLSELGADLVKVEEHISDVKEDKEEGDEDDESIDSTMEVVEGDIEEGHDDHSIVDAPVEDDDDDEEEEEEEAKQAAQDHQQILPTMHVSQPIERETTAEDQNDSAMDTSVTSDLTNSFRSIVLPPIASHDEDYYSPSQSRTKSCMRVKTMKESVQRDTSPSHSKRTSLDSPPSAPFRRSSLSSCDQSSTSASSISSSPDDDRSDNFYEYYATMFNGSKVVDVNDSKVLQPRRELHWGHIEIREYDICLGDNPACAQGCPVQLDWSYTVLQEPLALDLYVKQRPHTRHQRLRRLSGRRRQQMLLDLGYSPDQMKNVINAKLFDQKKRIQTVSRLKYMKFDEQVEKIVRVFPQVV